MRVLLTGASGFIGSHVAAELVQEGSQVYGFCRSEPPPHAGVTEWIRGDITDMAAVVKAVDGCDVVVHAAALYSYSRADVRRMEMINVQGTRNVVRACAEKGVRRLLVTSSSATCGPVAGRAATEDDHPPAWELRIPYKRTKLAAERLALSAANGGIEVVCVNPTTVVGARDHRPTPSGKMIKGLVDRRIAGYLRCAGINVVSVDDVARGHVLALVHGRSGERYILGGQDLSLKRAFATVLSGVGREPPLWPLPWHAVYGMAVVAELLSRLSGHEPQTLVRDEVLLSRTPLYFSSAKAVRELGYEPHPASVALKSAARWFLRARAEPPAEGALARMAMGS